MRRRINIRLLLWSVGVVAIFAAAFHGVHVWQVNRNAASLLEYARDAKAERKFGQAASLFDQYLKLFPKDYDAQEELALTLDQSARSIRQRARVVSMLEGLLLKSGNRPKAREKLIENLIYLGRYEAAARQLEILAASASTNEEKADVEHKRGWCLDAEGKSDASAQAYKKAVELDPKRVNSWILLAEVLHFRLSRDVEALKSLDAMMAANPDSSSAALARYRYHRLLGREVDAIKDLAAARRLSPNDPDVILAACQWSQSKGQDDDARVLLAQGLKQFPANEAMIKELANLELRQGRRDVALRVVEDGLKALEFKTRTGELQVFHADLLIDAGKTKEAAEVIAQLRAEKMAPALPDFLQARLYVEEKKWDDAQKLLEKSRTQIGTDPYWNSRINALLGICHGQLGDGERQIAALLNAARSEPRWAALNLSLGHAYLDADNPEQAITYLEPLLDDPNAPPLARVLVARARYRLTMALPERDRRWKDVESAIAAAERTNPGSLDLVLLRADVLLAQRKVEAARVLLNGQISKLGTAPRPTDVTAWIALADLEARTGQFERADETLRSAVKIFGDRGSLRLAKARVLLSRGRSDDRDALKALADDADAMPVEDRGRLHRDLAEMWLRQGDVTVAQPLLVRAAEELPRDVRSRSLLFDIALQTDRIDDARRRLKEMQAIEGPAGVQSTNAALLLRVEEAFNQPDVLKKTLVELKESPLRRGDGRLELIEARIYERLNDKDKTIAKLIDAVNAGQKSPRTLQRLVQLLTERKQYEQLEWALALLEGRGPLPRAMGRAAIESALAAKNFDQVHELLGPIDLTTVRDYRELMWLAGVERTTGNFGRAEEALRRAVAVAPHAPDAWAALASFLVDNDQRAQAVDLILDVDRKAPVKSRPLIRARTLEAIGELDRAEAAYEKLIKERPGDFVLAMTAADFYLQAEKLNKARVLFEKVLAPAVPAPPELMARARRGLAMSLPTAEGLKTLPAIGDVADDRVRWRLEGRDPAKAAGAIRKFEESAARGPFTPEESFWLAELYDATNQGDAAAARLDEIIANDRDTSAMLAWYARSLVRRGLMPEARAVAFRLLAREPDSTRSLEVAKLVKF